MNKQIVEDAKGNWFEAYVVTLSNGSVLHIDCVLADFYHYGAEAFVIIETQNAEKVIKEFQ